MQKNKVDMMKFFKLWLIASAILSPLFSLAEEPSGNLGETVTINVVNLPFIEGKVYIAVNSGDDMVAGNVIPVESDMVSLTFPAAEYVGTRLQVRAFQDLDESGDLEFESSGKPVEPCIRTEIKIVSGEKSYDIELIQY